VQGKLAGLSESAATVTTYEGLLSTVEILVLCEVLVAGEVALA
jgi:hypothetical protein